MVPVGVWVWDNRKYGILVSAHGYWHRAPEILIISWVIEVCISLMRLLFMAPGWGLVTRKTKPWLEARNFQACPLPTPFSWGGRGTGNAVNNQSCLHGKAPRKIPIIWSSESFQVGEHSHVPGVWCTPAPRGQMLRCSGPSQTLPMPLFIWLTICIFYDIS